MLKETYRKKLKRFVQNSAHVSTYSKTAIVLVCCRKFCAAYCTIAFFLSVRVCNVCPPYRGRVWRTDARPHTLLPGGAV
jgi:hypothetical protein